MIFVNPVSGAISFVPPAASGAVSSVNGHTGAVVLTASDVGALASVPVSRTVFVDVNGNNTTGVASDLSKPVLTISRAITLATALTPTAANPVVIQVGPGTFTENSGITLPAYVSLVGAGRTATILQSSLSSTGNCAAIVNPGDYSVIAFLKIQATGIGSGLFAFPLGTGNPGTGFTGVILRGLDIVGDTDAIYVRTGVSADLVAFDCILRSKWDSTYIPSGSSADFYNCQSLVVGQAASSSVAPTHGLNTGGGIVRWFGGVIQAQGSTAPGIANIALNATSGGVLEVYNAKIVRPTATASWDFQAVSGGSITYSGLARSDGAALTVSSFNSGTLTELSRYSVRDNNLSDLTNFATARTNLGLTALATTTPGTGVAAFLIAPTSANLRAALTDENGTGAALFDNARGPKFYDNAGTPTLAADFATRRLVDASGLTPITWGTGFFQLSNGNAAIIFDLSGGDNSSNSIVYQGLSGNTQPFSVNGRGRITLADDDQVSGFYELTINPPSLTTSRTLDWPNANGTLALTTNSTGVVDLTHGGTNATTAAGARTNLGATTVGANLFTVADPSAVRYIRIDASNGITLRTAAQQLSDIGGEPALGNPGSDGYLLSSTAAGVRSWIAPPSGGDTSTNTSTSVDSELALFSGTLGKTLKRATGSGIVKLTSGVLGFGATTADLTEGSNLYYTDARVRLNRLDQMAAPTAAVSMNSQRITNVTDPSGAQDAATKNYVDAAIAGFQKMSVRIATTANDTLSGLAARDGITPVAGDRVLVKSQTTTANNGVYVAASGGWSRAADADAAAEFDGLLVFVHDGSTLAGTIWISTSDVTTLGSDAITFTQFNKATDLVAGAALVATGLTWDVGVDGSTIEVSADALRVKDAGITLAKMANLAANSILGNNTGSSATPIALTASQVKTLLSLNNVENTALSTWAGTANITTLGTIATGTWQGTAIGATYLPGSFSGFANPSGSVGLTAVNGSATTAMRSDGAPALDQSIAPTWTGLHTHKYSDGATSTVVDIVTLGKNSSGTPAASFGGGLVFNLQSSTTVDRNAARLSWYWTTATDASRASAAKIALVTGAGSLTDVLYVFGSGGMSLNANADPGAGIFNANTGFRIGNAATTAHYLRGNGTNYVDSAIQAGDVPTLNQNTTGSAASLSISGQTGLLTFTGLASTSRIKTVRDAADTILELGGSYTPTGTWTSLPLTTPKVTTAIQDANGNSMLAFTATASAVDGFTFTNAATANPAMISMSATGSDSNVSLGIVAKGTGVVRVGSTGNFGINVDPTNNKVTFNRASDATALFTYDTSANTLSIGSLFSSTIAVGSNILYKWSSTTTANSGSFDTAIGRNGAGVVEINNGTAGQWGSLKLGVRDGGTTTVTNGLTIGHLSTGTPAAGLGSAILFNIDSTTTADRNGGQIACAWSTATDASRASYFDILLVTGAGALTSVARFFGSGGFSVNSTTDPGAGIINANTGFRIGNAATSGNVLRGNGTNFISATLGIADLAAGTFAVEPILSSSIGPTDVSSVGFRGIPQQSKSVNYTTVLADAGKHLFHPSADTTARTFTIDSNANVAYPIGTAITFINQHSGGVITIAITTDTMRLAGAGTTGSRTLAADGIATAVKVTATEWIISGTGLT